MGSNIKKTNDSINVAKGEKLAKVHLLIPAVSTMTRTKSRAM
uniref:Uncharacterized protein n=1 Tax=Arundo donax TaxID=35708 RepID=A0A0A8YUI9_ARUDO